MDGRKTLSAQKTPTCGAHDDASHGAKQAVLPKKALLLELPFAASCSVRKTAVPRASQTVSRSATTNNKPLHSSSSVHLKV